MATNYRLTMRRGPDAGQEHSLIADTVTLGRDPLADVVVNDPEVSRQHARLIRRGDEYLIQDLGSTNGTFLDGQRLAGELVPVAPGQVISIGGNVSLIFEAEGNDAGTVIAAGVDEEEELRQDMVQRGVGIYDLPEDEPGWEADDYPRLDRTPVEERDTILDYPSPPHDLSYQEGPRELPDFGPMQEDATPREPYLGPPPAQFRGSAPPPPPAAPQPRSNRNRNIILILLGLLLLCCCCTLVTYLWLGDFVMEYLGLYS